MSKIEFSNPYLKLPQGAIFKGTCGSYFKVLSKKNHIYIIRHLFFKELICLHWNKFLKKGFV